MTGESRHGVKIATLSGFNDPLRTWIDTTTLYF